MKITKKSPPEIICPKCSGRGEVMLGGRKWGTCLKCQGSGVVKGYPKAG